MMTCCTFVYSVINLTKTKQYVFFINHWLYPPACSSMVEHYQGILKGKYQCTIDLLFDLFGLACGCIFSRVRPFCEQAVSNLGP